MDKRTAQSLERIIQYLFWDEIRHWEELGRPEDHIYVDVVRMDDWLYRPKRGKRKRRRER